MRSSALGLHLRQARPPRAPAALPDDCWIGAGAGDLPRLSVAEQRTSRAATVRRRRRAALDQAVRPSSAAPILAPHRRRSRRRDRSRPPDRNDARQRVVLARSASARVMSRSRPYRRRVANATSKDKLRPKPGLAARPPQLSPCVRLAQREGYRARAACKLKEIDERAGAQIRPGQVQSAALGVATPGAWSQSAIAPAASCGAAPAPPPHRGACTAPSSPSTCSTSRADRQRRPSLRDDFTRKIETGAALQGPALAGRPV